MIHTRSCRLLIYANMAQTWPRSTYAESHHFYPPPERRQSRAHLIIRTPMVPVTEQGSHRPGLSSRLPTSVMPPSAWLAGVLAMELLGSVPCVSRHCHQHQAASQHTTPQGGFSFCSCQVRCASNTTQDTVYCSARKRHHHAISVLRGYRTSGLT